MTRISFFAAFMLLLVLSLTGCGGGGGTGGVNFTVNTRFPAYDAGSTNALARARSVWVVLYPGSGTNGLWAGTVPRPTPTGGDVLRRMHVEDVQTVDVQVLAYESTDGTGNAIATTTIQDLPVGSDITVSSFPVN